MHRITALALWLTATPALASTPLDKWTGSVGSATLEGQVDVTMYATPAGLPVPCVKMKIGDNEYLMVLASGSDMIFFSDTVVKKEGWKPKSANKKLINLQGEKAKWKLGGEISWVEADEIRIGDMVLSDVVGMTKARPHDHSADFYSRLTEGGHTDGFIGMSALPQDVVWAVRPSAGLVSFARGEAGEKLSASVQGTSLSYKSLPGTVYKFGKRKGIRPNLDLIVTGEVGGQPADVILNTGKIGGSLSSEIEISESPESKTGDYLFRHLGVDLGDLSLGDGWFLHTSIFTYGQLEIDAAMGMHHLSDVDMVVDPTKSTVVLAKAKGQSRSDALPFLLERAKAAVAPEAEEGEASAEAESTEETPAAEAEGTEASGEAQSTDDSKCTEDAQEGPPPGSAAAWSTLAGLYERMGDFDSAIDAREAVTKFDVHSCEGWQTLGKSQLEGGKIAEAIVSLEKASNLYHAWYDNSLEERQDLEKKMNKLKCEEKEAFTPKKASSSCHTADGWLAAALFSAGDMDTIESLYSKHLDLDSKLAMVTANARMVKGQYDKANEPLRQAIKLDRSPWASTRLGLALTYAKAGDWSTADGHYRRAMSVSDDHRIVQMWLEGVRGAKGNTESIAQAQAHIKANPEAAGAFFGLMAESKASGDAESIAGAQAMADAFFERQLQIYPKSAEIWSVYARYLIMVDRMPEARQAAVLALQFDARKPAAWLAMSDVERAAGNAERADTLKLRAAQVAPFHPGYALMMKR